MPQRPKLNRRHFVAATTVAAASAAAVRPSLAQSANETMNVAIIGAGGRGGSHVSAFLGNDKTRITHVVDIDPKAASQRAGQIEKEQGKRPEIVTDMRRVFDDASVDAISTATPNHWHALCGVWAMQAGKDCYIEKPICHNIAEGRALVEAAKKYKRICQVGTQSRSSAAVQEAVKFIAEGNIGEVKLARGLCYKRRKSIGPLGDYPIPEGIDFALWTGPATITDPKVTRQRFHYDWHWQRHYGNGDLGNQGPHQTDIARWGLGVDRHPEQIISYGGRLGYRAERKDPTYIDAGDTANTEVSIYDYGDKCLVFETRGLSVDNSADEELNKLFGSTKGNKIGVVFYGTDGYVVQKTYSHCIAYDKDMNVIKEFKGGGDHFGNFVDACNRRDTDVLNADAMTGHLSAGVSHLGNISYYLGEKNKASADQISEAVAKIPSLDDNQATLARTMQHLKDNGVDTNGSPLSLGPLLKFDPEAERFTNNDEANKMLTREYREGFVCPTGDKV
ncbi:Glucose--fructose oxidoreductase precursor [Roseimaritima multifibrata]|uniref:Glucose--fructose oxidoreductase n=1 Tax=Roseimaritima multifibrata TaxID=1930274 RepID=A0A517MF64_9BACT|nr:Gfo/Idh/MocA family oxidoreductase [Roseimaritima multifibrata]QDS93530.1 Glucose--fructose oxidoreductase precursor [Roseimaritima multifibrata]